MDLMQNVGHYNLKHNGTYNILQVYRPRQAKQQDNAQQ